jgi:hypothetical protein
LKAHPTDFHLEALYLDLGPEHRRVLDHLAGCARCRTRMAELRLPRVGMSDMPDLPESPGEPPDLHVFLFSLVLLQERAEAVDLLMDLLSQPKGLREPSLRIDPRFRAWGFVDLLVSRSLEAVTQDAEHAEALGQLALTASSLLDTRLYGVESIEDLRARAWGHIANARRVRSNLAGAEQGFASAKEAGRFEEARAVYRETRPLYREFPEPWVQNRRKWVRARILRGLGQPRLAESLLLAVRDGFLAESVPFDTALVSLEIASLYAEQGRTGDLKRLALEMIPVFSSLHIHREALTALAFLIQAIQSDSASAKLVAAVAGYLRQAEHDPSISFQAPEP